MEHSAQHMWHPEEKSIRSFIQRDYSFEMGSVSVTRGLSHITIQFTTLELETLLLLPSSGNLVVH